MSVHCGRRNYLKNRLLCASLFRVRGMMKFVPRGMVGGTNRQVRAISQLRRSEETVPHAQHPSPQAGVGSGLRGWLLAMMHNVFVNQMRAAPNETALDEAVEEATHEPFAHTAERLDLQAALLQLSPGLREIILLVCVEEWSYADAARVLDVPVGTVMSRLSRAREKLRELMDETAPRPLTEPALKIVKLRPADHGH